MGERPGPENEVSHGMCSDCAFRMLSRQEGSINSFLDKMDYPVLLVDSDVNLKYENRMLRELTGKNEQQLEERKGGEVFECVNWRKPGGCGKTIHCSGCTLRNTVEKTYLSGKPSTDVKTTLKVVTENEEKQISSFISTQKVGDYVLLSVRKFKVDG